MAVRRDEVNLQLSINAAQGGNTLREMQKEARDLRRLLQRLPVGSEEFDKTAARLKEINKQIADANSKTRALTVQTSAWRNVLSTAAGVFGALSFDNILNQLLRVTAGLFNIGTSLDTMRAKTETVFGDASSIVQGFAEDNARELGLAGQEYINLATSAGDLLKPMGFAEDAVAGLSVSLVDQAGILAEWSQGRVDTTQASEILTKALLGERDALNTLGIDIKDAIIQDELKRKGLDDLTGAARRQAEALITLEQITLQSASANEAYANNTESLARQKARLRARVAEISQTMADRLVPVFLAAIDAGTKLVNWGIQFAQVLAGIPRFLSENRVQIGLLVTALIAWNTQAIIASAQALRVAAAQRIATIATNAQAAAQRLLNFAMSANPIGRVIALLSVLAGVLVTAYQRSDTFRRVVTGAFSVVMDSVGNLLALFLDFGKGLGNLFTGNFTDAANNFANAFERINPLEIGRRVKDAFVRGYESVPPPKAEIQADETKSEEEGAKVGAALKTGFERQFEALRNAGDAAGKEVGDGIKKALDAKLKEIEIGFQKEELVADRALFNKELNEGQHAKRILELKKQLYEDQIQAFRDFNQEESREALQAQQKLVEIQTQLRRDIVQPLQALPTNQPGQVTSQTAPILSAADVAASDDDIAVLRDKFARIVDAENEHELQLAQIRLNRLSNRLELLRNAGLQESEIYQRTLDEKLKAEEDFQQKSLDNQRRTEEFKRALADEGLNTTKLAVDAAIELLSTDEQARKRNAGAIKSFQVAQVTVSGISEVQKIWEKAAEFGPFQAIIAAIQTAAAVARTTAAVTRINSAKFAAGGYTGAGYGSTDSTGFRPAGIVHEGEYVVPKWMVQSASVSPVLGWLEGRRLRKFAEGGLVNTSPSLNLSGIPQAADAANANLSVVAELKSLRKDVAGWNRNLRANVVYQDLEDTATEIGQVQDDASI